MKILWVFLSIILTFAEKLERNYLPPPGSSFSGGSLGAIDIPLETLNNKYSSKDEEITLSKLVIGIDRETFNLDNTFEEISNINNNLTQSNNANPTFLHIPHTTPINISTGKSSSLNIPSTQTLKKLQGKADREAIIINYDQSITPEGYAYSFDTSNGIHGEEEGIATNGVKAKGSYSYIGDDGDLYQVEYTADENGFVPKGAHLPTAPPIPDAILRVIEIAAKNKEAGVYDDGSYDDEKYGYKNYHIGYPRNQKLVTSASYSPGNGINIIKGDFINANISYGDNETRKIIEKSINGLSDINLIRNDVNDSPTFKKILSRISGIEQDNEIKENKTDMVTTPIPFLTPYVSRIDDDDDDLETSDIDEQLLEKQENHEDDDSDYVQENENPGENLENDSIWSNKLEDTSSPDKLMIAPQYGDRIRNNNELTLSDEKGGYVYKKGNQLLISPRILTTTSTVVPTEIPTLASTFSNTAEKSQPFFLTPNFPNKSLFDISTKSSNYPMPEVIPFVDTNFTSIIPGLTLSSKSIQTLTPGRRFDMVYRPMSANSNYPIIYNVQTSTEIIIGEEFNGSEQPQRFDPITGYNY